MRDERAFNFGSAQSVAAHVDYVIDATHDPEVTVLVAPRAVAGEINIFDLRPILISVTLVVAPDRSQHRWPGTLDHQIAAFIGAHGHAFARHHIDFDARERLGSGTGFRWGCAG